MIIDMHCHSVSSDDSRATVEQYLRWINVLRGKGYRIDGIVLTEHRKFDGDIDYSGLSKKNGVLILKGSELDTCYGHFLVYGVNDYLLHRFDFSDIHLDGLQLVREARRSGAIAVPAHPGRHGIGLCEFIDSSLDFSDIVVVEELSGSDRKEENERAARLVREMKYKGIGGSDAHFVSVIGSRVTEFKNPIATIKDLVEELYRGEFRPLRLEETRVT